MRVFCIRHQEMVYIRAGLNGHEFFHYQDGGFANGFQYSTIAFCDFPDGYAHCPPPEFDMEKYVDELEETIPSEAEIEAGLFETYDVDRDEMVYEVLL